MIQQRINFFIAFGIGYWIGQTKHGWKALFIAILLSILDLIVIRSVIWIYKNYKKNKKLNEKTT